MALRTDWNRWCGDWFFRSRPWRHRFSLFRHRLPIATGATMPCFYILIGCNGDLQCNGWRASGRLRVFLRLPRFAIYFPNAAGATATPFLHIHSKKWWLFLFYLHWAQWLPAMQWWPISHLVNWVSSHQGSRSLFTLFMQLNDAHFVLFMETFSPMVNSFLFNAMDTGSMEKEEFSFCKWLSDCHWRKNDRFLHFTYDAMETIETVYR